MKKLLLVAGLAAASALGDVGAADACGGCFTQPNPQPSERSVVTDHRMVLSVSTTQTVLWDQIRYSGDPAEFAWVLPVRPGATLQLSNDAFFTALDASTQPVIVPPPVYGGSVGCGLAGCGSQANASGSSSPGAGGVQLLSQSVVGPYETVTLRATDPGALRAWLKSHDFAIPDSIGPTIDAYVAESFDFLALRLRPGCGERAMQPVRIVTQGADPTLPLRMVAAGVGAQVGITLYVISEGRYAPRNFPTADAPESDIVWDRIAQRSNYEALTSDLMAGGGGRTWVTEYAGHPQLFTETDPRHNGRRAPGYTASATGDNLSAGLTPGLADAYFAQCRAPGAIVPRLPSSTDTTPPNGGETFTPCPKDPDASVADAAADADAETFEAGADAEVADADMPDAEDSADAGTADAEAADAEPLPPATGGSSSSGAPCLYLDDLDVALQGLHPGDVWLTRLRAKLPVSALSGDLQLEAARSQVALGNVHFTTSYADERTPQSADACLSAPKKRTAFGTWTLAIAAAVGLVAILRRRARRG